MKNGKNEVSNFVDKGNVKVYAENALNNITDMISIYGFSYKDDYIEEIDNEEDYEKVSNEIKFFDYREQEIIKDSYIKYLVNNINTSEEIFIVSSKSLVNEISSKLVDFNITVFSDFSANPKYEEIKKLKEVKKIDRLLIEELIEDIVIDENQNLKIIFKCEDKYFEALDFIKRQNYDIILSS